MERMIINYINKSHIKEALEIPKSANLQLKPLGQGEYNINYSFIHPGNNKTMVLRINTASQMHLENQIEYEFNALKLLQKTKRTPKPHYVDGSKSILPYGVLVMEYIEGRPLDYNKDFKKAAAILKARIQGKNKSPKPKRKRTLTEEQKNVLRERLAKARLNKSLLEKNSVSHTVNQF